MNTFSFKRIGWMLRADWIAYRKRAILLWSLAFVALIFLLNGVTITVTASDGVQTIFPNVKVHYFAMLLAVITYCRDYIEPKLYKFSEQFLTLPANTFEKFIEILLVGLFYFIAYSFAFWISYAINYFFFNGDIVYAYKIKDAYWDNTGYFLFVWNLLLLSCILFKQYGLQIAMIVLGMLIGIGYYLINISKIDMHKVVYHFDKYGNICALIFAAGLLYVVYIQIKRKQIR